MKRWIATLSVLAMIGGCVQLGNLFGLIETGNAELKQFTSEIELSNYLTRQIVSRHMGNIVGNRSGIFGGFSGFDLPLDAGFQDAGIANGQPLPPISISNESGGSDSLDADATNGFSQTTLQEAGVDESDVIKTDGDYLYLIDNVGVNSFLRIVDVSDPDSMTLVSQIPLEGYGNDIYLYGDKIISLTSRGGGFFGFGGGVFIDPIPAIGIAILEVDISGEPEPGFDPDEVIRDEDMNVVAEMSVIPEFRYERPKTMVTLIDITDRTSPEVLSATTFDGIQSSSRLIDGVLHLVISNFQNYFRDIMPMLGQEGFDVRTIDSANLMPRFERIDENGNTTSGDAITWQGLYRPSDPDGFGIVTLISLDVDDNAVFTSVGVVAEPGLIYSSRNALYLTDTNYNFNGDIRETTDIYKFTYVDRGADATSVGTIPGRILNQYSMGEHEGYLRVASTISPTFSFTGPAQVSSNGVYVLDEVGDSLVTVGKVENIAPRERIQAARFIGDRGFVVTFEQIDPLFTLDLSDPTNPQIIGELKVPGFSTFIVPMDENHLLTVGRYIPPPGSFGPWAVQLSIYDISDFANPTVMDNVIIGIERGAWSEALSNPKAFTYFAESNLVALPVSISGGFIIFEDPRIDVDDNQSDSGDGVDSSVVTPPIVLEQFDGVFVFEATVTDGFKKLGQISTRFNDTFFYGNAFTRGVFIHDNVFAITNRGVRGGPVSNVESMPFEFRLPDLITE